MRTSRQFPCPSGKHAIADFVASGGRAAGGSRVDEGAVRFDGCLVVPRHPAVRFGRHLIGVPVKLGQIFEGADMTLFASVDQTHIHVPNPSPVLCFVEERVLAMDDCFFECAFADIIV